MLTEACFSEFLTVGRVLEHPRRRVDPSFEEVRFVGKPLDLASLIFPPWGVKNCRFLLGDEMFSHQKREKVSLLSLHTVVLKAEGKSFVSFDKELGGTTNQNVLSLSWVGPPLGGIFSLWGGFPSFIFGAHVFLFPLFVPSEELFFLAPKDVSSAAQCKGFFRMLHVRGMCQKHRGVRSSINMGSNHHFFGGGLLGEPPVFTQAFHLLVFLHPRLSVKRRFMFVIPKKCLRG